MVYTTEGFTNNSPRSPTTSTPDKKPSAKKSLCLFTNILDVRKKTAIRSVGSVKQKHKAIKAGKTPWALKPDQKVKTNN